MKDYSKGKIYRLVCNVTGLQYIGHTIQPLSVRKAGHVKDYKVWKSNKRGYVTSFKVMENDNFDICLIEDYPCENVEQLKARERYWLEQTEETVNKNIPSRTTAEYYRDNPDFYRQYRQEYYKANKAYFQERNKHNYNLHKDDKMSCECGSVIKQRNKWEHFKSIKHKDWLKEQNLST